MIYNGFRGGGPNCWLTVHEYATVIVELDSAQMIAVNSVMDRPDPSTAPPLIPVAPPGMNTALTDVLPPYIRGLVVAQLQNGQVELKIIPLSGLPPCQTIHATFNELLMQHLCQSSAVRSFTMDGSQYYQIVSFTCKADSP